MTGKARKRGDVRFQQPPVKLVAERPADEKIEAENERLRSESRYPDSCGGA